MFEGSVENIVNMVKRNICISCLGIVCRVSDDDMYNLVLCFAVYPGILTLPITRSLLKLIAFTLHEIPRL